MSGIGEFIEALKNLTKGNRVVGHTISFERETEAADNGYEFRHVCPTGKRFLTIRLELEDSDELKAFQKKHSTRPFHAFRG